MHDGVVTNAQIMRYLNRLSSLLFVMARYEDSLAGASRSELSRKI